MFFILSKILAFVTNPLFWIVAAILVSLISRKQKWRKRWGVTGFILLLLFSNPLLTGWVLHKWEYPTIRATDIDTPYEIGILLSGFSYYHKDLPNEKDFIYLTGSANRLIQAIELYNKGTFKKFLLSGGAGNVLGDKVSESEQARLFLIRLGIPKEDILVEGTSRNTYENALFSKQFLEQQHLVSDKLLLISSATHMYRTKKCFDRVGLTVTPFCVDYKTTDKVKFHLVSFIPSAASLLTWNILLHEWVGIAAYKVAGYI